MTPKLAKAVARAKKSPAVYKIETITVPRLKDALSVNKGAKIVTLRSRTEPRMRREGNPYFGGLFKLSKVNGIINWIYGNSVNRQREREGLRADFTPEPRKWGNRVAGTPFVEHKDKTYIELKVERSLEHHYEDTEGNIIPDEDINPYLYPSRQPKTQGTGKEIILRDYDLNSVVSITMDGTLYIVVH